MTSPPVMQTDYRQKVSTTPETERPRPVGLVELEPATLEHWHQQHQQQQASNGQLPSLGSAAQQPALAGAAASSPRAVARTGSIASSATCRTRGAAAAAAAEATAARAEALPTTVPADVGAADARARNAVFAGDARVDDELLGDLVSGGADVAPGPLRTAGLGGARGRARTKDAGAGTLAGVIGRRSAARLGAPWQLRPHRAECRAEGGNAHGCASALAAPEPAARGAGVEERLAAAPGQLPDGVSVWTAGSLKVIMPQDKSKDAQGANMIATNSTFATRGSLLATHAPPPPPPPRAPGSPQARAQTTPILGTTPGRVTAGSTAGCQAGAPNLPRLLGSRTTASAAPGCPGLAAAAAAAAPKLSVLPPPCVTPIRAPPGLEEGLFAPPAKVLMSDYLRFAGGAGHLEPLRVPQWML
eukprot:CAMPEP_0203868878 /NCGR_PEP_ID=MMETSP0359-20131031/17379_1 /ASSEMBLY_ACC=CAM_ASM_000338 /TAXON_ID=268821 /ORGANISM="Scrippsiella Hangoei, Strain SHTV-5" /LENGTH=415 /DNA_ID=CAMNT_0050787395 /DNA_START=80 /DNA_END=1330 /DNA_ORIENTATION=+